MKRTVEIDVVAQSFLVEIETAVTGGRIIGVDPIGTEPTRRAIVETVGRALKSGKTLEQMSLNQLAFHAVLHELRRVELGK